MSNESDSIWSYYRQAQKERRKKRLPVRTKEIEELRNLGFKVEKKTDYQFRVNDQIDLYPIHNRYHNIKTKKRGGYKNAKMFIERIFKGE